MKFIEPNRGSRVASASLEEHCVSLETDEDGDGSTLVRFDGGYDEAHVIVSGETPGDCYATRVGGKQATVRIEGGPADTTVTAHALVVGEH